MQLNIKLGPWSYDGRTGRHTFRFGKQTARTKTRAERTKARSGKSAHKSAQRAKRTADRKADAEKWAQRFATERREQLHAPGGAPRGPVSEVIHHGSGEYQLRRRGWVAVKPPLAGRAHLQYGKDSDGEIVALAVAGDGRFERLAGGFATDEQAGDWLRAHNDEAQRRLSALEQESPTGLPPAGAMGCFFCGTPLVMATCPNPSCAAGAYGKSVARLRAEEAQEARQRQRPTAAQACGARTTDGTPCRNRGDCPHHQRARRP